MHATPPRQPRDPLPPLDPSADTHAARRWQADFLRVIEGVSKGVSPEAGIPHLGGGKKIRRMLSCLAKAMWEKDREFLKDAEVIAFTRDESHGRLVVRFTAAKANLTTRSGLFGQARFAGSSGQNIADATEAMLRAMATPLQKKGDLNVKGVVGGDVINVDQALFHALRHKVEMLSVDSASNETLAANIMRRPEQRRADEELLTPNLKVLVRDKAHGMRRRRGSKRACAKQTHPWNPKHIITDIPSPTGSRPGRTTRTRI